MSQWVCVCVGWALNLCRAIWFTHPLQPPCLTPLCLFRLSAWTSSRHDRCGWTFPPCIFWGISAWPIVECRQNTDGGGEKVWTGFVLCFSIWSCLFLWCEFTHILTEFIATKLKKDLDPLLSLIVLLRCVNQCNEYWPKYCCWVFRAILSGCAVWLLWNAKDARKELEVFFPRNCYDTNILKLSILWVLELELELEVEWETFKRCEILHSYYRFVLEWDQENNTFLFRFVLFLFRLLWVKFESASQPCSYFQMHMWWGEHWHIPRLPLKVTNMLEVSFRELFSLAARNVTKHTNPRY